MAGFVGSVARLERGGERLGVELGDGQRVDVDPRYADFLDDLRRRGRLVYVGTGGELLLPYVGRVLRVMDDEDGGVSVELWGSHARHRLPREAEGFEEAVAALRAAARDGTPLAVTRDDVRVVDVRPVPDGYPVPPVPSAPAPPPFPPVLERVRILLRWFGWLRWPVEWFYALTPAKAQIVFDSMKAYSCDPVTAPAPCIPFLYPDDGCHTRAEEMVQLMAAQHVTAKKVWSSGALHVDTSNHPACYVEWLWHVAPTIRVRKTFPYVQTRVVDPSLFEGTVTPVQWAQIQQATEPLTFTSATPYVPDGSTVTPAQHQMFLEYRRDDLRWRSVYGDGPPPYAHCR